MKHPTDNQDDIGGRYRELASETAPQELDQRVIRQARQAAERQHSTPLGFLFRPLAVIAVSAVVVTVALQFDLVGSRTGSDVVQPTPQTAPVYAGGIEDPGRNLPGEACKGATSKDDWQQCINELRRNGQSEAADQEQIRLDRAAAE